MIRNENEYQAAIAAIAANEQLLEEQRQSLTAEGLTPKQVQRGLDPVESFTEQIREEAAYYEQLKQGNVPDIQGFSTIGHALIALRIAQNVTQKELAKSLGVDPSQISRDEKNEYHGITIERAERVLQALGGEALIRIETKPVKDPASGRRSPREKVSA